jgi:CheY-like chemotaxis protein
MNVLWVEDNLEDNRVFADALEHGHVEATVTYAGSVADALVALEIAIPDLVVLDLNIPLGRDAPDDLTDSDVNGTYVAQRMRQDPRLLGVRIVCLTNLDDRAEAARAAGAVIVRKGSFASDFMKAVRGDS